MGLNNSDDITVLLYRTHTHTRADAHIYADTHFQLIPRWSRAWGESGIHGNRCPAQGLWPAFSCEACWMGSDNPTPPLLKLISSITVSLQRTDWITPVPLSSSLVLIPSSPPSSSSSYLLSVGPQRLKVHSVVSILPSSLCGSLQEEL